MALSPKCRFMRWSLIRVCKSQGTYDEVEGRIDAHPGGDVTCHSLPPVEG